MKNSVKSGWLILVLFLIIHIRATAQTRSVDGSDEWLPRYSTLGLGSDFGSSAGEFQYQGSTAHYTKYSSGIHVLIGASFLLSHFLPQLNHKLKFGDYTSAELGTGGLVTYTAVNTTDFWAFYRFQIGLQSSYDINKYNRLSLRLVLLEFAHNQFEQNISGSSLYLAYRLKRFEFGGSITAMRDRFLGWAQLPSHLNSIPHFYAADAGYYFNHQKISLREEFFFNQNFRNADPVTNLNTKKLLTTQLNYAILF